MESSVKLKSTSCTPNKEKVERNSFYTRFVREAFHYIKTENKTLFSIDLTALM